MRATTISVCAALLALVIPAGAQASESGGAFTPTVNAEWRGRAQERDGNVEARVPCIGNGIGGKRIEVLYLHPNDVDDRVAMFREPIRKLVAGLNGAFAASAGETGGRRQLRLVTDNACDLSVQSVQFPDDHTKMEFQVVAQNLISQGFNNEDRKYLVFVDGTVKNGPNDACGVTGAPFTSLPSDPRPMMAMVTGSCWNDVHDHELIHAFGAVDYRSPHASNDGHCADGADPICFPMYARPPQTYGCPYWHAALPDCGHDTYFHTNPKDGSYLDKFPGRNIANSPYLDSTLAPINDAFADATPVRAGIVWGSNVGATAGPSEPSTAGSTPARSIWFVITTPASQTLRVETSASSVDTVLGIYTGSSVSGLSLVKANDDASDDVSYSRVTIPTAAQTYYIRVDGKGGKVGSVRLNVLLGDQIPTLTGLTPKRSRVGQVEVRGKNLTFLGDGQVTFDANGVQSFDSLSSGGMTITARPYQWPGPITYSNNQGHAATDDSYQILPEIVSFAPVKGAPGTVVHVRGNGFASATVPRITIDGKVAKLKYLATNFSGSPGFDAAIKVPSGATDGKIAVKTSIGTDTSGGSFNVTA